MGNYYSEIKCLLLKQSSKDQCLPVTPYIRFPKDNTKAGEGGLMFDFHIYPEKIRRGIDDGTWFWWGDAQFIPFNDSSFFASTAAFQPRPGRHWMSVQSVPSGRVLLYDIVNENKVRCQVYARTNSSVYPKLQPHPIGQCVCYCGTGEVVIMSIDGDPVFQKSRDLSNAVHVYCAIAKNGISFACLKKGMGSFFLETLLLDHTLLGRDSVRCHMVCPGFLPSRYISDNVQCKFSPDSNYITVSSSTGYLFTVTRIKLTKFCIICPDILDHALSAAGAFDYSPRFPYQILSVATLNQNIFTLDLDTKEILLTCETEELVDCLHYSPDGLLLAAAFKTFDIRIYNSEDLSCIHSIPMSGLCEDQFQRIQNNHQSVLTLSFSQNGENLISSSCDGHLRLWHVPHLFTLKELCRDSILSSLPVRRVKHLPLPSRVKDFLTYKYF